MTAGPSSMPGTARPAIATIVSASTPKTLANHAELSPSFARAATCPTSCSTLALPPPGAEASTMTPIRKSPIRGRLAYSARSLEALHEFLACLGHFGRDHKLAVRLIRIPREVVLVIALGRIELVQ